MKINRSKKSWTLELTDTKKDKMQRMIFYAILTISENMLKNGYFKVYHPFFGQVDVRLGRDDSKYGYDSYGKNL